MNNLKHVYVVRDYAVLVNWWLGKECGEQEKQERTHQLVTQCWMTSPTSIPTSNSIWIGQAEFLYLGIHTHVFKCFNKLMNLKGGIQGKVWMEKRQGGNAIIILWSQVDVSRRLWDLPGSILFSLAFSIHISQLDAVEIFKETIVLFFINQSTNIFIIPQVSTEKNLLCIYELHI